MREAQAMQTKLKLMESAQALFAEKGYKGTSVREINHRVGVTEGMLYHYFPGGKKELFRVIVQKNLNRIVEEFSDKKEIASYVYMPLEEVLESVYLRFIDIIDGHIDIIRIMLRENEVRDIITKEDVQTFIDGTEPWFKMLLEKKSELGEIGKFDFESAAIAMDKLLVNHIMLLALGLDNEKIDNQAVRKRVFRYFVDMWKVAGAEPAHPIRAQVY